MVNQPLAATWLVSVPFSAARKMLVRSMCITMAGFSNGV
jgi:hypothetical protein